MTSLSSARPEFKMSPGCSSADSIAELRRYINDLTDLEAMQVAIGIDIGGSPPLYLEKMIVVCLDTETYHRQPKMLTEIGISTFTRQDSQAALDSPGPHSEKRCKGDPERNRFGQTRFVNKEQAIMVLEEIFAFSINGRDKSMLCPVVCLGHGVSRHLETLRDNLGFNIQNLGTIVRVVDIETIDHDLAYSSWDQPVSLRTICDGYYITAENLYTAGNNAMYTAICAVRHAMGRDTAREARKPMDEVVEEIAEHTKGVDQPVGKKNLCTRCGRFNHRIPQCKAVHVRCSTCAEKGFWRASKMHVDSVCPHKGWS
ncbi:unnamed protein product [Periconia digitata]|uniref:Gfd2/YDR514C-like C-terminal domain-containing protein n=1 Tax=Periconia digitata TaxID=1303443 RepID=A0A9W4UVK0_9PLEO|nr:unnamed protein product [Periconia digitata]